MHMPQRPPRATELLPNYISAGKGPNISAKAWSEDRGFEYLSATNDEELDLALKKFIRSDSKSPIILEIFSDMIEDTFILKNFYSKINPYIPTLRERVSAHIPTQIKSMAKRVLRK